MGWMWLFRGVVDKTLAQSIHHLHISHHTSYLPSLQHFAWPLLLISPGKCSVQREIEDNAHRANKVCADGKWTILMNYPDVMNYVFNRL